MRKLTSEEVYLYHHGILGQKWGKRNGPPYPLNPDYRSSDEKRLNGSRGTASGLAAYKNAKLGLNNKNKTSNNKSTNKTTTTKKNTGGGGGKKTTAPSGWIQDFRKDMDNALGSNPDFTFGSFEEFTNYLSNSGVDISSLSEDTLKSMYKTAQAALTAYKGMNKTEKKSSGKSSGSSGKGSSKKEEEDTKQEKEYLDVNSRDWKKSKQTVLKKILNEISFDLTYDEENFKFPESKDDFIALLKEYKMYFDSKELPNFSDEQIDDLWKDLKEVLDEYKTKDEGESEDVEEKEEKEEKVEHSAKITYSRNAYLYHHGILGQKWGVRNGPPYPLSRSRVKTAIQNTKRSIATRFYNSFPGQLYYKGPKKMIKEGINNDVNKVKSKVNQNIDKVQDKVNKKIDKTQDKNLGNSNYTKIGDKEYKQVKDNVWENSNGDYVILERSDEGFKIKPISQMSDNELMSMVNRIRLENNLYSEIQRSNSNSNSAPISTGRTYIDTIHDIDAVVNTGMKITNLITNIERAKKSMNNMKTANYDKKMENLKVDIALDNLGDEIVKEMFG